MDPATIATLATVASGSAEAGSLIPLAVGAAGALGSAALQNRANQKMTDRQTALNNQMSQYESQKAAEGRGAIERYLQTVTPEARQEAQTSAQQDLSGALTQGAQGVQGFEVPGKASGNLSPDYSRVRGQTQDIAAARLKKAIQNLSILGAPAKAELNRAIEYGRTTGQVSDAAQAGQVVGGRYNTAIGAAQPDPNLAFASQVVAGITPALSSAAGKLATPKKVGLSQFGQDVPPSSMGLPY